MDNTKKIRLIQVAKEFKVGFNTLADFLQRKGLQSDCSPSSPVTAEVYAALEKEFGRNRQSGNERNAVRERIQQKGSVSITSQGQKSKDEDDEEVVVKSNVISVKDEVRGPKILGKIDLNPKKEEVKKEEIKK
ncbi:MAG: translation initiation factor IF-2, partial [Alistipes sp.]|nr:translation initiation factor IF-2 [Alistipes sp.]